MDQAAENANLLRRCYNRWHETRGGSVDEWMAIVDDTVAFRSLAMGGGETLQFTAPKKTKAEVEEYFRNLIGDWSMVYFTVDHYVAEDDKVCVICNTAWKNRKTGKTFETPKVDVWQFRNGKAVSFFEYYDTAGLIKAATP
ncbi:MAG: nuclear transport factor 2 family protein [Hyphomicrobiales bacterium]|nr:nuclear transport factor 2 family protein [Hyphomicrobiales bacterium]